jgi:hypothetical protein
MGGASRRRAKTEREVIADFSMPSGRELSRAEWNRDRTLMYGRLREHLYPPELIACALAFRVDDEVTWYRERDRSTGAPQGLHFTTRRLSSQSDRRARATTAYRRFTQSENVSTAGEVLAMLLRFRLADLIESEHRLESAPVRAGGHLSRRQIADIAMDLLGSWRALGQPPGPQLIALLEQLLSLGRPLSAVRAFDERQRAIHLDATQPGLSTREVGDLVGVDGTTVLRWRRQSSYRDAVEAHRKKQKSTPE